MEGRRVEWPRRMAVLDRSFRRSGVAFGLHLLPPQVGVTPGLGKEFVVGPPLNDPPRLHHEDLVDGLEPGQAMGHEDQRATVGDAKQVGGECVGSRRVEMLGRLVEQEHREIGQQSAGHRQTLALAARKPGPVCAHLGGQTIGQFAEPCAQPDPVDNAAQLLVGGVTLSDPEVLGHGGLEEVGVLSDQPDHGAEVVSA